ncbi:hypothetical protein [Luteolibacter pohnpeiensis]|nr:hypothetical protein [Luteolibacter pohnpeiensis]
MFSVRLTEEEIQKLNEIADQHGCIAKAGIGYGEPSARRLIAEIARGSFFLQPLKGSGLTSKKVAPKAKKSPPTSRPKAGKKRISVEKTPPDWWPKVSDVYSIQEVAPMAGMSIEEMREWFTVRGIDIEEDIISTPETWEEYQKERAEAEMPAEPESPERWTIDEILAVGRDEEPDWWEGPVSRGSLTGLLLTNLGITSPNDVEQWIKDQGEWEMDGVKFVRAVNWKNNSSLAE